jgi:hypothetical protein
MVRCPQKLEGNEIWSMNHFSKHHKPLKNTVLFAGHVDQQVNPHQSQLCNEAVTTLNNQLPIIILGQGNTNTLP